MFNPVSIDERMMFSTVLIKTDTGSGTGCLFGLEIENSTIPILLTNKHVVNNNPAETISLTLALKSSSGLNTKKIFFEHLSINWLFLPSYDICFCFIGPLLESIKRETSLEIFHFGIPQSFVWAKEKLSSELSMIEDVIMVGYPIGISGRLNNYPVFRKGITASHPGIDFLDKGVGVIDAACFPGSSGSPIFILNKGNYVDKYGTNYLGSSRIIFLGMLYSGPVLSVDGKLRISPIPTSTNAFVSTDVMVNLGYYVMADEMLQEIIPRVTQILSSSDASIMQFYSTGSMRYVIL
jgi:V8-like Glu-specific endopeptidase